MSANAQQSASPLPVATRPQLLTGLSVLELGDLVAVPRVGRLLVDLGADVTKVERPDAPDRARAVGPFAGDAIDPERSGLYMHLNAGKRSVVLDFGTTEGAEILGKLLGTADVLLHSFTPSEAAVLNLDTANLLERYPMLVVTAVTGFGHTGPRSEWRANDLIAFHAAGIGSRFLGDESRRPLRSPSYLADTYGAVMALHGTLIALRARTTLNSGQFVDVSSSEALASLVLGYGLVTVNDEGKSVGTRTGNVRRSMRSTAPGGRFPCSDGDVQITVLENKQWVDLVRVMGNPEWTRGIDPDSTVRLQFAEVIDYNVAEFTEQRTVDEVVDLLVSNGIPCAPCNHLGRVFNDPHLRQTGGFRTVSAGETQWEVPAPPWRFWNDTGTALDVAATQRVARVGEHTSEVLESVGCSPARLTNLREIGRSDAR